MQIIWARLWILVDSVLVLVDIDPIAAALAHFGIPGSSPCAISFARPYLPKMSCKDAIQGKNKGRNSGRA